jgi:hypothetical protein
MTLLILTAVGTVWLEAFQCRNTVKLDLGTDPLVVEEALSEIIQYFKLIKVTAVYGIAPQ